MKNKKIYSKNEDIIKELLDKRIKENIHLFDECELCLIKENIVIFKKIYILGLMDGFSFLDFL